MKLLGIIIRVILSLRYKVVIKGQELLKQNNGTLVMPNHQALVDPIIMTAFISKYRPLVPVVTERFYQNKILHPIFKFIKAVPVSDLTAGSRDTDVMKTISKGVTSALSEKRCILLYPAGQITGQGYEKIFNKQGAWAIVQNAPANSRIIAVRIRGLWGSMWSKAWTGKTPDLISVLLKGAGIVLANLIFFVPRRKVDIEFIDITENALTFSKQERHTFNNFLETIYNAPGEEPVSYLKHYFYAPKSNRKLPERISGSVDELKATASIDNTTIPDEVLTDVIMLMKEEGNVDAANISLTSNLNFDLNIDSLTMVVIITAIERHFKVDFKGEASDIKTVADLCIIAMGKQELEVALKPSFLDVHKEHEKRISVPDNSTIPHLFLKNFKQHPAEPFSYDKILGCSTRKGFLLKAMVVSRIIEKEVKGQYVGIMLPAMQSTTLLVAATYLANKVPVMLNWTVGKNVLEHCVKSANIDHILTAWAFFDRVRDLLPDSVKEKCIFFEKKAAKASLFTKLSGVYRTFVLPKIKATPDDTAVILFTSGSEAMPKTVPLSHRNILSDLHGAFEHLNISNHNIFMGFLPPFHSFGFTVLTALPLATGTKVAYSPDPTANREILRIMIHTKATVVLATPTFLKMILSIASPDDLKNINYAITGAESAPKSLFDEFKNKTKKESIILEGYGITECSPVLTINPIEKQKNRSVGQFIKGVKGIVVDLNTNEILSPGKEGMIMVRGNNIFKGYMGDNVESPFVKIDGNEYYKTGDLGYIDEEGFLFITGRLKRFIKMGGEMISMPAVENVLLEKFGSPDEVVLAVEGTDKTEPPVLVLFSKLPVELQEVNAYLKSRGFSNLVKINRVEIIEEIPLLGSGKTDYKLLKAKI